MFYKILPYLIIVLGAFGIYQYIDSIQKDKDTLVSEVADLKTDKDKALEQLKTAALDSEKQKQELDEILATREKEQETAKVIAEASQRSNAELKERIRALLENAKNDPKDDCSYKPMPEHIVRLLNDTRPYSDNENGNQDSNPATSINDK